MPAKPDDSAQLHERLRARVQERHRRGEYPPGLEEQLDRHYVQILKGFDRQAGPLADVHSSLERLRRHSVVHPEMIETWSPSVFKRFLHQVVAKLTVRQTRGVLAQVQDHYSALDDTLTTVVDYLAHLGQNGSAAEELLTGSRGESDADRRLAAALDRLSRCEDRLKQLESDEGNSTA
jgi:hypothetical protein|tara:strand:+ start:4336 stop:4869 length:534 start_codon:yes stop_codon:yes gene_type:complete